MPPPARTTCKVIGCQNPAYVFPGGSKHTLCQEHLKLRNSKQRGNLPSMSGQMRALLQYLREMDEQGFGFVDLKYPLAHKTTVKALMERDWIFASKGIDGIRYRITGRGMSALEVYEPVICRRDGICPRCCEKPRHVRSSGKRDAFCADCERAKGRQKRAMNKDMGNPDRPCSRCGKRPRHPYPGGKLSTYCKHCETVRRRRNARKERRQLLKAVRNGAAVPICPKCKSQPRRVSANCIAKYCTDCKNIEHRKYKLGKRLKHAGLFAPAVSE